MTERPELPGSGWTARAEWLRGFTEGWSANLRDEAAWKRVFASLLFAMAYGVVQTVVLVVMVVQGLTLLLTGAPNARLGALATGLARYVAELVRFLTFVSEERPFPIGEWPGAEPVLPAKGRARSAPRRAAGTSRRGKAAVDAAEDARAEDAA